MEASENNNNDLESPLKEIVRIYYLAMPITFNTKRLCSDDSLLGDLADPAVPSNLIILSSQVSGPT